MSSHYLPHHASSHSKFSSKGECFGSLAEPTFPTTTLTDSNERMALVNYVALLTGKDEKIWVDYGTKVMWEVPNP